MSPPLNVLVIDMQPITPAVGGGRQRLLGLYHALGDDIHATYVGTYDWRGERERDVPLTPGLRERLVPLSAAHHAAAEQAADRMAGRVVIDLVFADQASLSPEWMADVRARLAGADVVVFSHPWCYPPFADDLRPHQRIVYESHNVEAVLRASLHQDLPQAADLLRRVTGIELALCRRADLVLACSQDDVDTFNRVFDVPWSKLRLVPNGIFAFAEAVPDEAARAGARRERGIDGPLVVFLGSDYGPNNDAARFIAGTLAPALPDVAFALIGSCCNAVGEAPSNLHRLGILPEENKRAWLRGATIAVNPLAAGSGTSIKMFDFMAAGLPVVTTAIGARGIESPGGAVFVVAPLDGFVPALRALLDDPARCEAMGRAARNAVEAQYAWERISPALGHLLRKEATRVGTPRFSVIVPTYERHGLLDRLLEKLEAQVFEDFEVIVVDQSAARWPGADASRRMPVFYVHTPVRGAVKARNLGAQLASGVWLAYTDDDCEPAPDWLANGARRFEDARVVGVEGLIRSDKLGDDAWRPVTNVGFEGIGFMTANLMVRTDVFRRLGGFDVAFDQPHFREDTDFGWRMQAIGQVPYADDVVVYHPPHRRDMARESQAERNIFFEKDALLLRKHPERYKDLFFAECHFERTPGFWPNFMRGLAKYGVQAPSWILDHYEEWARCNTETEAARKR